MKTVVCWPQAVNATVHFAQESRDKLLQCIVEGMDKFDKEPSQKKKKSCLQDYTNLCHMIPQRVWNLILDDSRSTSETLESVVMWAGALGLKHPSEPTMGGLVALAFWKSWSVKPVSNSHKHYAYTLGKKVIREMFGPFWHFRWTIVAPTSKIWRTTNAAARSFWWWDPWFIYHSLWIFFLVLECNKEGPIFLKRY